MVIWKFKLQLTDEQVVAMPLGARILSVAMQGEDMCVWALVDPGRPSTGRKFMVFGTGNPVEEYDVRNRDFVGSVQERVFVWHVFDCGEV